MPFDILNNFHTQKDCCANKHASVLDKHNNSKSVSEHRNPNLQDMAFLNFCHFIKISLYNNIKKYIWFALFITSCNLVSFC